MAELASWTNMKIQNNQASLDAAPGWWSAERVRVLQFEWILQEPFSGFLRKSRNSTKVSLSVCPPGTYYRRSIHSGQTFHCSVLPPGGWAGGRKIVCTEGLGAVFLGSCWEYVKFPSLRGFQHLVQ